MCCGMLGRQDNLRRRHFPNTHKEVELNIDTEYYLKVGERPHIGTKHVISFLDHIGSTTLRPLKKSVKSVSKKDSKIKS